LLAEHSVEAAEHRILAHQYRRVRTERIEDSREFNGDVPATDDRHALRPVFQFEKTVGGKAEFRARYLRYQRFAACRYHYSVGAVMASVDIYGLVVQETRRTADQVDTTPLEVTGIDV